MSRNTQLHDAEPVGQLSLWFGLLGGAAAWAAHLVFAYALVPLACAQGLDILLYATIPATLAIAAAAVFFAWRGLNRSSEPPEGDSDDYLVMNRVRFMAISGILVSAFFLAVIVAQSVPIIMQDPCEAGGSIRI